MHCCCVRSSAEAVCQNALPRAHGPRDPPFVRQPFGKRRFCKTTSSRLFTESPRASSPPVPSSGPPPQSSAKISTLPSRNLAFSLNEFASISSFHIHTKSMFLTRMDRPMHLYRVCIQRGLLQGSRIGATTFRLIVNRFKLLTRLVALNHERAAEEKRGLIRWLRPDYQAPLPPPPSKPRSKAWTPLNIQHPTSNIQHPTSNIQHPTSKISRLACRTARASSRPPQAPAKYRPRPRSHRRLFRPQVQEASRSNHRHPRHPKSAAAHRKCITGPLGKM